MKQRLFFLAILILLVPVAAFPQEISVKSFKPLPADLTARMNPVTNDNGQACALLKIITTETGFTFETDALGMCKEVEYKTAEIWLWLAPGSRVLTIKHPQLGQLRNYEYPVAIEKSCTYEMVLLTGRVKTIVEELPTTNWVAITVEPQEALLKIDGEIVSAVNGQVSKMLSVGEHTLEGTCPMYHPYYQKFEIKATEKTQFVARMKPNSGYLNITTTPESGATVYIDGERKGTTPFKSDKMESKTYTVQVVKEMFKESRQQVTVKDNLVEEVKIAMQPNFAEPAIVCPDGESEIWVNGEKKAVGSWSGRLPAGAYQFEARKPSHKTSVSTLTLQNGDNRTINLPAPSPIYGVLNVNSTPFDADILLDGKKVGTTPERLSKVLIGDYELTLQKAGCSAVVKQLTVKEGETVEINETLRQGMEVTLTSEPSGAVLYIDGNYAGTAPHTAVLSFGTHTVKAVNDGVEKQESIAVRENGQTEWKFNVRKGPQTEILTVNGVSFKMVAVQGGTFTMGATLEQGSDADSDEKPIHSVTVSDYCIGETEVTQALWQAVMGSNPSYFKGSKLPVEYVSWDDCQQFIAKLNQLTGKTFRLPTEAEWEYAARGGNRSKGYKYSGSNSIGDVAWYYGNSGSKTHPVGTKSPNELGLYDMSGNVWEWCSDWYGNYGSGAQTDPAGPAQGDYRVSRGGSWIINARYCRVSFRINHNPSYRYDYLGFRLVMVH